MRRTGAVFVATLVLSQNARADDSQPGDPPTAGFHIEQRARRRDIVCGAVLFGIPYVVSVMAASFDVAQGASELAPLYAPVAGPFITLGALASKTSNVDAWWAVELVGDGVLQAAGMAWLLYGLLSHKSVVVLNAAAFRLVPHPILSRAGGGVGIGGAF